MCIGGSTGEKQRESKPTGVIPTGKPSGPQGRGMKKANGTEEPGKAHKLLVLGLCVFVSGLIGWFRLLTGPDFALSLFYLLPILSAVWYLGRKAGVLISICSAASWLVADLKMLQAFSKPWIPFLNETFRLVVFLIITFLVDKLKLALEDQKALARCDSLTQAANRRGFTELAEREMEKARRSRNPISVVYLDIDDFKTLNDHLGHGEGDRLLCRVAETLKKNVRSVDVVARLGGDEFCLLLGETDAVSAASITRKLQGLLLDLTADLGFSLTYSFGVATFEKPAQKVNDLVGAADRLMYAAKKAGKNRIRSEVIGSVETKF